MTSTASVLDATNINIFPAAVGSRGWSIDLHSGDRHVGGNVNGRDGEDVPAQVAAIVDQFLGPDIGSDVKAELQRNVLTHMGFEEAPRTQDQPNPAAAELAREKVASADQAAPSIAEANVEPSVDSSTDLSPNQDVTLAHMGIAETEEEAKQSAEKPWDPRAPIDPGEDQAAAKA